MHTRSARFGSYAVIKKVESARYKVYTHIKFVFAECGMRVAEPYTEFMFAVAEVEFRIPQT